MKPELAPLSPSGHSTTQKLATIDTHACSHTHTHAHIPTTFFSLLKFQRNVFFKKLNFGKKGHTLPNLRRKGREEGGRSKEVCVAQIGCVGVPISLRVCLCVCVFVTVYVQNKKKGGYSF